MTSPDSVGGRGRQSIRAGQPIADRHQGPGGRPGAATGTEGTEQGVTIGAAFAPAAPRLEAPTVSLPVAGGAIRGIGETFSADPATGTGSLSVPIASSQGRSGFGPSLSLGYDSGRGNGPFGLGWSLSVPALTRRTDKGLPRYDDTDTFLLSGAEDLVPALTPTGSGRWEPVIDVDPPHAAGYRIERFRPRTEGLFARIERWTRLADGDVHWRSTARDGVTHRYGEDPAARITDPADLRRVFSWLLCRSEDLRGNAISYEYLADSGVGVDLGQAHERHRTEELRTANRYLKRIRYGNRVSTLVEPVPAEDGWLFEVVLDYGEHDPAAPTPAATGPLPVRSDPFSVYRAGFEVRTYRLCRRVLTFHHFPGELGVGSDCLVRSTDFTHVPQGAVGEVLTAVTQRGYRRTGDGGYLVRAMPPVEFSYTPAGLIGEVQEIDADSLANLPAGLGTADASWVDLDGEGIAGILMTAADAWYYKPNLGDAELGGVRTVPGMPSPALGGSARTRLLDLDGDGRLEAVTFSGPTAGRLARTADGGWEPWQPFASLPAVDVDDPDVRLVDLDGDGHADLLAAEGDSLTWYPSMGPTVSAPASPCRPVPTATTGRGCCSPTPATRCIWRTCRAMGWRIWSGSATAR
ncbi:hypothetical protein FHG89_17040 [Micromonospora orduensis]|uniref:Toxin n=1 Tax=Micromonospora orduensis TaxID=1420891 RepID=A0A5C4QLR1_9ACTN|nr:SpvB/TcaC N-terminal domain-containing protein [Micromonospora orduensis]TNH27811.1 hypothetical protein FHG89_17040 [Micromonospora orduensis]